MADPRVEELKHLLPQCLLPDWVRLGSRLVRLLRDCRHPDQHDAILSRLLEQARASIELRARRLRDRPVIHYPPDLPITSRKDEIVAAIRAHQVVVIAGETGSGKTTQIPKMCLEAGLGIEAFIGCTQPRRVAALSISQRIAEELNLEWGRGVGCKIRFDDRSGPETYVKLMTDGILLAELQGDPLLSEYNALIIDEAHERSLNIDFILGYLKGLLVKRTDLKLIVTSATIDTEAFSAAFGEAPILEVSGRLYPVEVRYTPLDIESEERGDLTYVDAAVAAVEEIMTSSDDGDVLIFLPGERDIRETRDLLETRLHAAAEIIPLFGRLSAGEQQRVFAAGYRRKIVVATNIAETSLTIPGIRYIIDTGLARVSRYNARTRTRRLPIEPISQSSANQRKGRAGRVRAGVCIRLFSEEDFDQRPAYTQPEIQRANLAEVILRMKAFHLGEIESFPFLNPPQPAAIAGGYRLLQELGALDERRDLTSLGRDLARLPIDPTLGRMLLQSEHEQATRELLIIAAGLSIQDPRERPLDQKEAAAAAHDRFADPRSDFLTLLNIWNVCHGQWESLRTQNQRRKYCRGHYLSYLRMLEWQDLHAQLEDALADLGTVALKESSPDYDAIHRSILTGLLGHVAFRKERNLYQAAGNRPLSLFPGSVLFERLPPSGKARLKDPQGTPPRTSARQPAWIVAGELVETSQFFARTVAGIDPLWIVELAPHLCRSTFQGPHWSPEAGRVLVEEKITFEGLEVLSRKVAYGNIQPKEATEIFIRAALVEEGLFPDPSPQEAESPSVRENPTRRKLLAAARTKSSPIPARYRFLERNRETRHKIETWQTRLRRHDFSDVDQTLFEFYAKHIENVSSLHELDRLLQSALGHPDFLCASEADLTGGRDLTFDQGAFPDAVSLEDQPVAITYQYAPGEEQDGVTVKLPFSLAQTIPAGLLEWAVPGLRSEKIHELLRALPKSIRRELLPLAPKVVEIVRELQPAGSSLAHDLGRFIQQRYGIRVPPESWAEDALPPHLRPRVEVLGPDQKPLVAGRNLNQLRQHLKQVRPPASEDDGAWSRVAAQWERFGLSGWTFGDLPDRVTISEGSDLPVYAWPGVQFDSGHVNVRLFRNRETARRESLSGTQRLIEQALQRELGWLQKDLRAVVRFQPLLTGFLSVEELETESFTHLLRYLLPAEPLPNLTETEFQAALHTSRERLAGLSHTFLERLGEILKARLEVGRHCAPTSPATGRQTFASLVDLGSSPAVSRSHPLIGTDLAALLPKEFLRDIPFERLSHLPRYLKALSIRVDRAGLNPAKDQERARQLAPYVATYQALRKEPERSAEGKKRLEEFRWMLEEFRVSLFAQELGTAVTVSPKRLDHQLETIREAG